MEIMIEERVRMKFELLVTIDDDEVEQTSPPVVVAFVFVVLFPVVFWSTLSYIIFDDDDIGFEIMLFRMSDTQF